MTQPCVAGVRWLPAVRPARVRVPAPSMQASAIFNRRASRRFLNGIEQLEKVVAIDPAYACTHARLASMYAIASEYTPIDLNVALAGAREHADIAIALAPGLAEPHAAMARVHGAQGRYIDQQDAFERALAQDPNYATLKISTPAHFSGPKSDRYHSPNNIRHGLSGEILQSYRTSV